MLPIHHCKSDILQLIKDNNVCIITGDTGSGKSTQISQFLHEAGYSKCGVIAISQPRRVGAVSVARRVAQEMNVKLGVEVGYTIRFDDVSSANTKIRYMTDGCLLREVMSYTDLEPFSVVVLDEAHERSLQTDILFGILRNIVQIRSTLKLIITSATLDTQKFSEFFFNSPCYHIPGRCYPVCIEYATKSEKMNKFYVDAVVQQVIHVHTSCPLGDILAFLTGQDEIERACNQIGEIIDKLCLNGVSMPDIAILPVYAALPAKRQQQIFSPAPPNCRKVLISTNICETSLTVNGIAYVIDSGYVKVKEYDPSSSMDILAVKPISQVAATQRTGRAGRTQSGVCFRMYTEQNYNQFIPELVPEILRTNLCNTVLILKELNVTDVIAFDLLDKPSMNSFVEAMLQLYYINALDDNGKLTVIGKHLARFPTDPYIGMLLLEGVNLDCFEETLSIAAMLATENIFVSHTKHQNNPIVSSLPSNITKYGDHITYLHLFNSWNELSVIEGRQYAKKHGLEVRSMRKAVNIRLQLSTILFKIFPDLVHYERTITTPTIHSCRKAIARAFFPHAARHIGADNRYRGLMDDQFLFFHPSSLLHQTQHFPNWVVYTTVVFTTRGFMRNVNSIDVEWIKDLIPRLTTPSISALCGVQPDIIKQAAVSHCCDQNIKPPSVSKIRRRNNENDIQDARQRYMERKKARIDNNGKK